MRSEWRIQRIGDFAKAKGGKRLPAGTALVPYKTSHPYLRIVDFRDGGIDESALMYVPAEVFPAISRYTISPHDIYVSIVGTIGLVGQVPPHLDGANLTENAAKVTDLQSHVTSEYVRYYLQSPEGQNQIRTKTVGSTQPKLALFRIEEIEVPIPPLPDQREITSLLQLLETRIALLRQTNATLEAIAQALFKSWFIDFDPVRARSEGRQPEGMDAETAALFPSEFEESELGLIPRGWQYVPFGKLLGVAIGGDWGSDEQSADCSLAAAIIRGTDMPDIRSGTYDRVPQRFVSPKKAIKRSLVDGDIAIEVSGGSKTQPTGRSLYVTKAVIEKLGGVAVPASFCRLFRPRDAETGLLMAQHLESLYRDGKMWEYQVQSTGLANFQTQHFLDTELVIDAPRDVFRAFYEAVRPLVDKIAQSPISELATLRDALLPRLISGKLRIPEAREQIDEALG